MKSSLSLFLTALILSGCAAQQQTVVSVQDDIKGKTLANIRPVGIRLAKLPAPKADTKEAIRRYQRYLEIAPNNDTKVHVMHRLADLKLLDIEEMLVESPEKVDAKLVDKTYNEAIATYRNVLAMFPDRSDSDMLYYQLAKVYQLKGMQNEALDALQSLITQFPESELVTEAYYRRGDMLFYDARYAESEVAFKAVSKAGKDTRFFASASYMKGWAQFKQAKFDQAQLSFVEVLDTRFPDTEAIVSASSGDRELLNDTVRVMSMVFVDRGGVKAISDMFKSIGDRHYEYLVYDGLGQHYRRKNQYSDAARTYLAFVQANPDDVLAPTFYSNIIASYKSAGYADLVLEHKATFIDRYGASSDYWKLYGEDIKEMIRPYLKTYTLELAQYNHSKGQKAKDLSDKFNSLLAATKWYKAYIDTFPDDNAIGEQYFLRAEAFFDIGRYTDAVVDYENSAYKTSLHSKSAEAGYAALLSYNQIMKGLKPEQQKDWLLKKVSSAMAFADKFPDNDNTSQVLAKAAEGYFELGNYASAVIAADRVIANKKANNEQRAVSYRVKGHSEFDLAHYRAAEDAYTAVLAMNAITGKEKSDIRERLAACIYKQGVAAVAADKLDLAVDEFMRVGKVVPESDIKVTAHYDAAAYLMKKSQWPRAVKLLTEFRETYPDNKLTKDIPSKLIVAYENMQNWSAAAFELQAIWRDSKDPEEQRIALYQAAEYYEKSGDLQNTAAMFKRYAANYPKPFDAQLEAINKLEGIYAAQKDDEKRRYWLAKLIDAHRDAGKDATPRSRFLSAKASLELAHYERDTFNAIKLTLPLQKSLADKKVALKRALDAYQATAKMEVLEFTTAATYQIAEIYGQLSRDLMASQRPADMDELELEEYEVLLEDQAFPFEEAAINVHSANIKRTQDGLYDQWIKNSFTELGKLMPARYNKEEQQYNVIANIH
ncbi:MAG: tetratricopeptide repeat protein [Oceanospirillaceae bacterium]|nr:tetratricopeptide repeat protein [Oceanospirillaceae bacterium]MCP5350659.1 tetratricopeptide repeat protein [Oceanospirillaceae bacterium]